LLKLGRGQIEVILRMVMGEDCGNSAWLFANAPSLPQPLISKRAPPKAMAQLAQGYPAGDTGKPQ
jgi:hypothetical protein